MEKVNLFLVGAMRSGTTTLFQSLSQQPSIFGCPIKEPNFFIDALPDFLYTPLASFQLQKYLQKRPLKPKHIAHIRDERTYQELFADAPQLTHYQMEASAAYLSNPEVPNKIHAYKQNAKVIIVLRDPLDRIFSHYQMNVGLGREKRNFEAVVTSELECYKAGKLPWYSYLSMSLYDEAIERYHKVFGKNVLLISFDDLVHHPHVVLKEIGDFLNLSLQGTISIKHLNASNPIRFKPVLQAGQQSKFKSRFSKWLPNGLKQSVFRLFIAKKEKGMNLSFETLNSLQHLLTKKASFYYESRPQ